MKRIYLGLAIHNHQPLGNFPWVFEDAYQRAYLPMLEALLRHPSIKVVNNSPLGKFSNFAALKRKLDHRVLIQIQDGAPLDVEHYYTALFDAIDDFRGVMLAPFVIDNVRMSHDGGYVPATEEPFITANRIVAITRQSIAKKLAAADRP